MDELQTSLEALLHRRFHIVPTRTNRQDQWYKRWQYYSQDELGGRDILILSPKDSRDDWAPELREVAAVFGRTIRGAADEMTKQNHTLSPPSDNKLFGDSVLDGPSDIIGSKYFETRPLKANMQRISYWTPVSKLKHLDEHCRAIKALLECEQATALLCLAHHPEVRIAEAVKATTPSQIQSAKLRPDVSWGCIVEETLEMLLFLTILKCFPEVLQEKDGYEVWLPFLAETYWSYLYRSTVLSHFKEEFHNRGAGVVFTRERAQGHMEWCIRVLTNCHVLSQACELPSVDWERRLVDAVLKFVGFETWNRQREGEGYLGCSLNKTKDEAWLRTWARSEMREEAEVPRARVARPKDPLLLHEPPREPTPEPTEEEEEQLEKLAELESQEATYGRKRSTKYRRHNVTQDVSH